MQKNEMKGNMITSIVEIMLDFENISHTDEMVIKQMFA